MKASYVSFFVIIMSVFLSGCVAMPQSPRPVIVSRPVTPGSVGFENQQARDIRPLGYGLFTGRGDTVTVISNLQGYYVRIAESAYLYPGSDSLTVALDRVERSYNERNTNFTIQVFEVGTNRFVTTLVSPNYNRTQVQTSNYQNYSRNSRHVRYSNHSYQNKPNYSYTLVIGSSSDKKGLKFTLTAR